MYKVEIRSLPIDKVIKDMAESFGTTASMVCEEYFFHLPEHLGRGKVWGNNLKNGLGLINYDCTFNEETEIHFCVNKVHPLKFIYLLNGIVNHRFENQEEFHRIQKFKNVIVASAQHNGHVLKFEANTHTTISSEEINRLEFLTALDCTLHPLNGKLKNTFLDTTAKKQFYHKGYYSLQMARLFETSFSIEHTGFLRRLFLKSFAFEILLTQIVEYQDDIHKADNQKIIRAVEVKQIYKAVSIINGSISDIPTLSVLAKEVGLNINKLQNGFKQFYNMTFNEFVTDRRMNLAKAMLENSSLNISEIREKIGFKSNSHFSQLFKSTFGKSPSDFRKATFQK